MQISINGDICIDDWLEILSQVISTSEKNKTSETSIQIAEKITDINHYCVISDSNNTLLEKNEICRWKSPHTKFQLIICGDKARFPKLTDEIVQNHFLHIYQQILTLPKQRIKDTECIPEAELNKVLHEWNSTEQDYPLDKNISELFFEQAKQTPNQIAIRFKQQSISYQQLNLYVNQFAQFLLEQNVRPEDKVGLCLTRSPLWPIGMLAIWKVGAIFLPLESELPDERLNYIIQNSESSLIVTQEAMEDRFTPCDIPISTISIEKLKLFNALDTSHHKSGEKLAYIIYTSGTTGLPKGVKVGHRGLTNLPFCQFERMEFEPNQRILQAVSFNFDASLHDVTFALLSGSTLCIADENERLPGPAMVDFLRKEKINFITLPPSALETLPFDDLPELRTILAVGEVCSANLVQRWVGKKRFFNGYGPTETTVGALIGECGSDEQKPSIGRALANVKVYILDHRKKPVPIGVTGEIYVGGVGVAKGYINRPKRTKETFISNPFSNTPSTLYKTGDKARFLPDGRVDFIGRIDDQVKIAGRRIELEEIESRCKHFKKVKMAAVIVHQEDCGPKILRAFILLNDPSVQSAIHETLDELKQYLAQYLPTYMLPNQFFLLQEMPKSINGKLDRQSLQKLNEKYNSANSTLRQTLKLDEFLLTFKSIGNGIFIPVCYFVCNQESISEDTISTKLSTLVEEHLMPFSCFRLGSLPSVDSTDFIERLPIPSKFQKKWPSLRTEPYTKTQILLAKIWLKYLSTNNIYLDDNFIELGGDSLIAVKIILDVKKQTNIELTGADLFGSNFGYSCARLESRITGKPFEKLPNSTIEKPFPVKAFFFENNKTQLYGVYHPSHTNIDCGHAVLICPPITNDYQRSRPLLQQLATKLSIQGYPCMRFDFTGNGDSFGDYTDVSMEQFESDILFAIEELCTRSKCTSISVFGIRFAATLLTNLEMSDKIKQIILFDPIINGRSFLNIQRNLHTNLLRDQNYFQWRKANIKNENYEELLGQEIKHSFIQDLERLELTTLDNIKGLDIQVIVSDNVDKTTNEFFSKNPTTSIHQIKDNCYWQNQDKIFSTLLAPSLYNSVLKVIQELTND